MSISVFFAQAVNATNAATAAGGAPDAASQQQMPFWATAILWGLLIAIGYLIFIRPQSVAQKKQTETLKSAKTGDKIITSSGIHRVDRRRGGVGGADGLGEEEGRQRGH